MSTLLENPLSPENRQALARFSERGDCEPPMVFVGRGHITQDIEQQLRRTRETASTLANARLVEGAPGSGKSSLLLHLNDRHKTSGTVIPVRLLGDELVNPVSVASDIVSSCGLDPRLLSKATSNAMSGHFGLTWVGVNFDRKAATHSPEERLKTGSSLWDVLYDCVRIPPSTTFLFLIDEAQRIQANPHSKTNQIVTALLENGHTGHLRTFSVFAGLSDSTYQLQKAGASPRLTEGAIHQLGCFEPEEAGELLIAFYEHAAFGLDALLTPDRATFIEALASVSECYPRHLHSYLRVFAKSLAEHDQLQPFARILEAGHALRIDYYRRLLHAANLDEYKNVLCNLLKSKSHGDPFTFDELQERAINQHGMTRQDVKVAKAEAIHCGILEYDPDRSFSENAARFPIPSFRTYAATGWNRSETLRLLSNGHECTVSAGDL